MFGRSFYPVRGGFPLRHNATSAFPACAATREKLETALKELVDPSLTHAQMRAVGGEQVMASPERRAAAQEIMDRLAALRARCQRQTNSIVTPMGDEMFYRYQQSLIDEAATTLGALLPRVRGS